MFKIYSYRIDIELYKFINNFTSYQTITYSMNNSFYSKIYINNF